VIIFGSVWFLSKKHNHTEIKKKTETGSNQSVSVWFIFLDKNRFRFDSVFQFDSVLARFGWVFLFWLGFFGLARFWLSLTQFFWFSSVFLVWARFDLVFSVSGL
jgi:hypothetical protein